MAIVKRTEYSCGGMAWDWTDDLPQCDHCGANAEETELSSTAHSGGVICGDISCWNDYMMSNVWGDTIEPNEIDVVVCDECGEDESTAYFTSDNQQCDDCTESLTDES